jgi:hypothetical protein
MKKTSSPFLALTEGNKKRYGVTIMQRENYEDEEYIMLVKAAIKLRLFVYDCFR